MKLDHLLKKKKILFIDIIESKLILNDDRYFIETDFNEILNYIINNKKQKNWWFFCFNLNTFVVNFLIFLKQVKLKINIKTFLFNNKFYYLEFFINEKKIKIKSFTNFFQMHYSLILLKYYKNDEKLILNLIFLNDYSNRYNIFLNKTLVIKNKIQINQFFYKLIEKINKEMQELNFYLWLYKCNSVSALALNLFLNFFNLYNLKIEQSYKEFTNFQKSFYGGVNLIFGNPQKNDFIYYFDFNSMYPTIMNDSDFLYDEFTLISKFLNNGNLDIKTPGFYYIVFSSNMEIPILPQKIKNKIYFVNGSFLEGLYWNEEILFFLENGGEVHEIKFGYIFKKKEKIFSKFTEFFIQKRKENNFNNNFYKSILVSFFGRLGSKSYNKTTKFWNFQKYIKESEQENFEELILNEIWIQDFVIITLQIKIDENAVVKSNNFIASQITSKARIKLFNLIFKLKQKNIKILYCDTDSIFFCKKEKLNIQNLETELNINNIKPIRDAVFINNKFYFYKENNNDILKISGIEINNKFNTLNNIEEIKKKFYLSKESLIKILKKNNNFQKFSNFKMIKIKFNNYKKRKFSKDKKKTTPWTLNKETGELY